MELNGTCTYCGIVWCALQLLWKGFLMWVECWGSRRCLIFHPSILSHLSVSSFSSFIISHHDTFDEYFTQAYYHTSQSPHFHLYLIFIKEYLTSIFHPSILSHIVSHLIFTTPNFQNIKFKTTLTPHTTYHYAPPIASISSSSSSSWETSSSAPTAAMVGES